MRIGEQIDDQPFWPSSAGSHVTMCGYDDEASVSEKLASSGRADQSAFCATASAQEAVDLHDLTSIFGHGG